MAGGDTSDKMEAERKEENGVREKRVVFRTPGFKHLFSLRIHTLKVHISVLHLTASFKNPFEKDWNW